MRTILLILGLLVASASGAEAFLILNGTPAGGPCGPLQFLHTVECNAVSVQVFGS